MTEIIQDNFLNDYPMDFNFKQVEGICVTNVQTNIYTSCMHLSPCEKYL